MYQIAICDDETEELDKTKKLLMAYGKEHPGCEFEAECFVSPEALLQRAEENGYMPDLILLDIYMPEIEGTVVARKLRRLGSDGRIIFLTSSVDHALEAFRVDALQYLVKPVVEKDFFAALDKCVSDIDAKRRRYLLLKTDGMTHRIAPDTIVFCEAQGKRQFLHLSDGSRLTLHLTMAGLYGMLEPFEEFARVGAAYIVNLEHIIRLNSHHICLDTGENIYLPRGAFQPLKKQYFKYYCDNSGSG